MYIMLVVIILIPSDKDIVLLSAYTEALLFFLLNISVTKSLSVL